MDNIHRLHIHFEPCFLHKFSHCFLSKAVTNGRLSDGSMIDRRMPSWASSQMNQTHLISSLRWLNDPGVWDRISMLKSGSVNSTRRVIVSRGLGTWWNVLSETITSNFSPSSSSTWHFGRTRTWILDELTVCLHLSIPVVLLRLGIKHSLRPNGFVIPDNHLFRRINSKTTFVSNFFQ